MQKICKQCRIQKSLDDFYSHPQTRDKKHPECKACHSDRQRARYLSNKDSIKEYTRAYRKKNREAVNANLRRYYKENASILKAKKKLNYYKNPAKYIAQTRAVMLKGKYGITPIQYDEMHNRQKGRCVICGSTPKARARLDVDHNHQTGKVRGLLCMNCNAGLGHFRDSENLLRFALHYLEFRN